MKPENNTHEAEAASRAEQARQYYDEVEAKIQAAIPEKATEKLITSPVNIRLLVRRLSRETNLQRQAALIEAFYCKEQERVSAKWSDGEIVAVQVQTTDTELLRRQIVADVTEAAAAFDESARNRILRGLNEWSEHQHQSGGESGSNRLKTAKELILPTDIDTPEARRVFGRALAAGYLAETSTGRYKWVTGFHGAKAAAAYLCTRLYSGKYSAPPWGALGRFLGLTRLDAAAYQNKQYTKTARPWKQSIDKLFED